MKIEIPENENRKEFTFSERVDWAKRLERVESIKAKGRNAIIGSQNLGLNTQNSSDLEKGETRQIVAEKAGFGNNSNFVTPTQKTKKLEQNNSTPKS